jgi:hypothetical protein
MVSTNLFLSGVRGPIGYLVFSNIVQAGPGTPVFVLTKAFRGKTAGKP